MLIPEKSVRISYWSQMLYGNKAKGEAFLSNLLYIESWALEAIDDGVMVMVIYDPRTPNGSKLVEILEDAGYGGRALSVLFMLQLNLEQGADWNVIVDDADLMQVIWNNATSRNSLLHSAGAMTAVANSTVALTQLMANNVAWTEAINNKNAMTILASSNSAVNFIIANPAAVTMYHSQFAMEIWFTVPTSKDFVLNSTSVINAMVSSRTIMNVIGRTRIAMSAIYNESETWRAAIAASPTAIAGLNDVAITNTRTLSLKGDVANTLYSAGLPLASESNTPTFIISVEASWSGGANFKKFELVDNPAFLWQPGSPYGQISFTPSGSSGKPTLQVLGFGKNISFYAEFMNTAAISTTTRYILC